MSTNVAEMRGLLPGSTSKSGWRGALHFFKHGNKIRNAVKPAAGCDLGNGFLGGNKFLFRVVQAGEDKVILEGVAGNAFETA